VIHSRGQLVERLRLARPHFHDDDRLAVQGEQVDLAEPVVKVAAENPTALAAEVLRHEPLGPPAEPAAPDRESGEPGREHRRLTTVTPRHREEHMSFLLCASVSLWLNSTLACRCPLGLLGLGGGRGLALLPLLQPRRLTHPLAQVVQLSPADMAG